MVKDVKIYFIGLKKTCLGVSDTEDRDKDNKTSLKEERVTNTEDRGKDNKTSLKEERVINTEDRGKDNKTS